MEAENDVLLAQDRIILEHLTTAKKFQSIDNYPRDYDAERRAVMEDRASLLLHASIGNREELTAVLETGLEEGGGVGVCATGQSSNLGGADCDPLLE